MIPIARMPVSFVVWTRRLRSIYAMACVLTALSLHPLAQTPPNSSSTAVEGQTTIQLPDASKFSVAERELLDLERHRSRAIAAHDLDWLATLYGPDFAGIVANGRRVDRGALFGVFGADNPQARFRIDELGLRTFGPDTATVTGRLQTLGADGAVAGESRYLHVYVRRQGRWQIVAAAGSAVR